MADWFVENPIEGAKTSINKTKETNHRANTGRDHERIVMSMFENWVERRGRSSLPAGLDTAESIRQFCRWVAPQANRKAILEGHKGSARIEVFNAVFQGCLLEWALRGPQVHVKKTKASALGSLTAPIQGQLRPGAGALAVQTGE
jgi:hypothetical protein